VARFLDGSLGPVIEGAVEGMEALAQIYPSTILIARRGGVIRLGEGVYLGRRVELEAGEIEVGPHTTIQDGSAVRGQVRVGAYCQIGHNVLIISNNHRFMDNPVWLIREQDRIFLDATSDRDVGQPVVIDEDCWLGWCCTVMPGAHVGRGAILSANSVITNDIGPYEIHGGIPNRKIGERMTFAPPERVSAVEEEALPYFYSGFSHLRHDVEQGRARGVLFAGTEAKITLMGVSTSARLEGTRFDDSGDVHVQFWLNGADAGRQPLPPGRFTFDLHDNGKSVRIVPGFLRRHTVLEWSVEAPAAPQYGVACAELIC
jgi:acetyltransferase-like isoleucine patch superfamily enzyme